MNTFSHTSVLLFECIEALNIRNGYTYVDCTAGGGGHSLEIAKRMGPDSRLICFDRDKDAIKAATKRLEGYLDRVTFVNDNFSSLDRVIKEFNVTNLGGVLADLGCSSYQFDTPERGFSYMHDAALDMRMDTDAPLSAYKVVNEYSETELKKIIYDYGEERYAPQIASAICRRREEKPIETTLELVDIIRGAMPPAALREKQHPAKRSFQAIRIAVNDELGSVEKVMRDAIDCLNPGGRLAIITFHSLEDRIVKNGMQDAAKGCTCPPSFPVCVCGKKPRVKLITRKPIVSGDEELEMNPRARSAKLRVCEKL